MGRQSLKTYMNDLLRRSHVQRGDLVTIIDDNARAPSQQLTPPSRYLDSLELCHLRDDDDDLGESSSSSSTEFHMSTLTLDDVDVRIQVPTTPNNNIEASTRRGQSGLGLLHSPRRGRGSSGGHGHDGSVNRERIAPKSTLVIPFCLSEVSAEESLQEVPIIHGLRSTGNDFSIGTGHSS